MSKLKHYKGEGWEVKVKYDDDTKQLLWTDQKGIHLIDKDVTYQVINMIDAMTGNWKGSKPVPANEYEWLTEHLDTLTAPKIINEHTFDNDNFKIRIWETEDKIGGETLFVREGYSYKDFNVDDTASADNVSIVSSFETHLDAYYTMAHFGNSERIREICKEDIDYTYTDLYQALERAEQETSELTYETVVKELEGLEGDELWKALHKYQVNVGMVSFNNITFPESEWKNVATSCFDLFAHKELIERGLIKLRRVK